MFGHHHISDDRKLVAHSNFLEDLEELGAAVWRPQQGPAVMTARSNEVQISGAATSAQTRRHVLMLVTGLQARL